MRLELGSCIQSELPIGAQMNGIVPHVDVLLGLSTLKKEEEIKHCGSQTTTDT